MNTRTQRPLIGALTALAAASMLAACDNADDPRTAGQQLDAAVAQVEQKTQDAAADVKAASEAASQAMNEAADTVSAKAKDARITAAVNAQIAKDDALSVLGINVDTQDGHVSLYGKAPSEAARDRATTLAQGVEGVASVDNRLVIASQS